MLSQSTRVCVRLLVYLGVQEMLALERGSVHVRSDRRLHPSHVGSWN